MGEMASVSYRRIRVRCTHGVVLGIIVPKKKAAKEAKAAGSGAKKRASKQKQASSSDTEPSGSQSTSASSQQERIVGGVPFVKHTILANGIVVVNKSVPNGGPAAQVELAQQRVRNNSSTPAGMVALAQKRARANGSCTLSIPVYIVGA